MNFFWDVLSSRVLRLTCALLVGLNSLVPCAYAATVQVRKPSLYTRAFAKIKEKFSPAPLVKTIKPRTLLTKQEQWAKLTRAQAAVKDEMNLRTNEPIITTNEWRELQFEWLLDVLDRAQTSFGKCALRRMIMPTDDFQEIKRRQSMIKMLVEDDAYYRQVKEALARIYESEDDILAYWGEGDALAMQAASIYYRLPLRQHSSKIKTINNYLNNSRKALEAAMWIEWIKSFDSFFISLLKVSIAKELLKLTVGMTDRVDIDQLFIGGITEAIQGHNPFFRLYNKPYEARVQTLPGVYMTRILDRYDGDPGHYAYIMDKGSFGDKVFAWCRGARVGEGGVYWGSLAWVANNLGVSKLVGMCLSKPNYQWDGRVPGLGWEGKTTIKSEDDISLFDKVSAVAVVGAFRLWDDYTLWVSGEKLVERIQTLHSTMRDLRSRLKSVANFLRDVNKLERVVEQKDTLAGTSFAAHLKLLTNHTASDKFKELISLLKMPTFKGEASFFYLRGRVLRAHKLCAEIKKELSPAIAAIGELDAYYALATLVRESHYHNNGWTFAEFVDEQKPCVELKGAWISVINPDVAVPNDIIIGGDEPGKMLITGPNGGGKSTILKTVGHVVSLAQSWTIVPAKYARLTLFDEIKTCLRSEEDLSHGMSTFMAEKHDMDVMKAAISDAAHSGKRILSLIDEPYRGTVDEESAERIYQLGQFVAPLDCVVMMLATHVKKPTRLEYDTQGAFANYHAEIRELFDSSNRPKGFERLFKLERGAADWWFNDAACRSRFIDWLGKLCAAKS